MVDDKFAAFVAFSEALTSQAACQDTDGNTLRGKEKDEEEAMEKVNRAISAWVNAGGAQLDLHRALIWQTYLAAKREGILYPVPKGVPGEVRRMVEKAESI